jgi:branched-chain amino acid transport system substrate-binding protein
MMKMRGQIYGTRGISVLLGIAFFICLVWVPSIGNAEAPKVVKFGCVFPLTGPVAAYGEYYKRGVDTAVEYINETGGLKGLGGAKLEVVYGDNQMKPAVAASETERLIEQEKVVAVFGVPPSVTTLSASASAERLKTPFLDPTSFADQLCKRGFKYFFELQPTAFHIVETQVNFLTYFNKAYGLNIKKVGIIHEDTDYGKSLSKAQRELLPKAGFEIVADIEYNAKAPDLSSPVLKLKSAAPQFVIQSSYFPDSLSIAKIANRIGLKVPFLDAEGKAVISYPQAAGSLAEGDFVLAQWNRDQSNPVSRELVRRYEAKYKEKAFHNVGAASQLVLVLKKAIETAGSTDRQAINDALHKIEILPGPDLILPVDKIKFDESGMNTHGRPMVTQIQGGQFVNIWPERFASKKALILDAWKKK